MAFKAYWQPKSWGGENDWKRPPGNATYDAAANFMLGESGTVAGFSENELLFWTNLVKGFNNNPINVMDIQAGIATGALVQHLGAGVTVVPVNFP